MLTQEWHAEFEDHRITVRNSSGIKGLRLDFDIFRSTINSEATLYIDGKKQDSNEELINLGRHPSLRGSIDRDGQRPAIVEVYFKPTIKKRGGYNCEIYIDAERLPLIGEQIDTANENAEKPDLPGKPEKPKKQKNYLKWIIVGVIVLGLIAWLDEEGYLDDDSATTINLNSANATYCCDVFGNRRCPLVTPGSVGAACFCPGQGSGVMCQ